MEKAAIFANAAFFFGCGLGKGMALGGVGMLCVGVPTPSRGGVHSPGHAGHYRGEGGGMVMSRALRDISAVQDVAGRGKTTKTCDQGSQKIWEGIGLVLSPQILFSV